MQSQTQNSPAPSTTQNSQNWENNPSVSSASSSNTATNTTEPSSGTTPQNPSSTNDKPSSSSDIPQSTTTPTVNEEKPWSKPGKSSGRPSRRQQSQSQTQSSSSETCDESQADKSKISIVELKSICKQLGVKGYSKKTKSEIIQLLLGKFKDDPKVQRIELLVKNVQYLKKICHELQIRGYSKKKKTELVDIICSVRQHNKELSDELNGFLREYNLEADDLYQRIFLKALNKMEAKKIPFSVTSASRAIFGKNGEIEKEVVKLFYKRIMKRCALTKPDANTVNETPSSESTVEKPQNTAEVQSDNTTKPDVWTDNNGGKPSVNQQSQQPKKVRVKNTHNKSKKHKKHK